MKSNESKSLCCLCDTPLNSYNEAEFCYGCHSTYVETLSRMQKYVQDCRAHIDATKEPDTQHEIKLRSMYFFVEMLAVKRMMYENAETLSNMLPWSADAIRKMLEALERRGWLKLHRVGATNSKLDRRIVGIEVLERPVEELDRDLDYPMPHGARPLSLSA